MRLTSLGALLIVCFLGTASVLAVATHEVLSGYERQRAMAQFDEYLAERAFDLEREMLLVFEVLRSLQALYDASNEVKRDEFATFVSGALGRHDSIHAMEWVPRVPAGGRAEHESAGRAAGFASYEIRERDDRGRLVPASDRSEYYPVFYVDPLAGNERALGFDLGSDPLRCAALVRARETGDVTLSNPVVLVQEEGSSQAVLAFLPVPGKKRVSDDAEGFVVAVLRIADVVRGARLEPGGTAAETQFELTCADVRGDRQVLYPAARLMHGLGSAALASAKRIEVGGNEWRLAACPTEGFVSQRLTIFPLAVAAGVFALVAVLGAFVAFLATRSRDLAVRRQDRTIRAVLGSLVEGVVVADREGKMLLANEAAERTVGLGVDAARPGQWSETYGFYLPDMETPYPERELPLARAIRGETVTDQEIYVRRPDMPKGVWLRANAAPLANERGELLGGVVTLRDVTASLRSDELVRRLSSAVEQTADAVFITDRDGEILYVNPAFETTTGYAAAAVLGKTPRILKSGEYDLEHYRNLWGTILGGEVYRATTINRKRNGEPYFAEQTITPMKDARGQVTHFVSVSKDMTERLRIQEQEIEMRLAAEVQQQLYPAGSLESPGLDIAGAVFSAEATCGDYYDFIRLGESRVAVVIGDVSGHGLAAAMVMAQTRAYLRAFAQSEADVATILERVNTALGHDLRSGFFVTLLLAAIDVPARRLVYASAGHTPGLILDSAGEAKELLARTGIPLGIDGESEYGRSVDIALDTGDVVVLITDGVTESRSPRGDFFGSDGLLEVVRAARHESARAIVGRIHDAIHDFRAGRPQDDDVTILVCRVEAPPAPQ